MTRHVRITRIAIILIVVIMTTSLSQPRLLAELGLDFWPLPRLNLQIEENLSQSADLERESVAVKHRMAIKDAIVEELIAGSLDLLQAAARFRNLDNMCNGYLMRLHRKCAGLTDEECICRNVIEYVAATLERRRNAVQVLARLESEFQRFREGQGDVRLPS